MENQNSRQKNGQTAAKNATNTEPKMQDGQIHAQENQKSASQNQASWMNDSRLSGIDPAKLQMLLSMSGQGAEKSQNELMPFLLSAASRSREQGMTFTPQETDLIIEVMKQGKSKEEIARIDKIRMMMRLFRQ